MAEPRMTQPDQRRANSLSGRETPESWFTLG